jgi:hypothetical protein
VWPCLLGGSRAGLCDMVCWIGVGLDCVTWFAGLG